jgi:multimeric flavodoxin WrbA
MADRKTVILNGAQPGEDYLTPILSVLTDVLRGNESDVQTFTLRDIKLAHCIGCFGCWVETPGTCIEADAGRDIARAIIRSEMTVLFTPVTCGGYSSELKRMVDRFIQLALPYFSTYGGEIHHPSRYACFPRVVVVGVQRHSNHEEAKIFQVLVGRNAINFHAASYAVEVVVATDDAETLRRRFQFLVGRTDPLPSNAALASLLPARYGSVADTISDRVRRALLIVGSPKTKSASTSGVLGGFLLDRLEECGWEIESLTLNASLRQETGQARLCSAVERADLVLLVFPLYIDALPFLVTKALEVIVAHRSAKSCMRTQRLAVVCNSGFPEAHQSAAAVAICHRFAEQCGMMWAGALAMGAGEALSSGQLLTDPGRSGPPVAHVIQALDLASAALDEGRPVPSEATTLIARSPIPFVPFAVWRWLFARVGDHHWNQRAAANGMRKSDLLARPYAA